MQNILALVFMLPIIVWSSFQQVLISNANQIDETLMLAVYEGQKQASIQGYYDEDIYNDIKNYLVTVHNYDRSVIDVSGTETETHRGDYLIVEITIPRPVTTVIELFSFGSSDPYTVSKTIMSEYVP